jgi:hypothetical protein
MATRKGQRGVRGGRVTRSLSSRNTVIVNTIEPRAAIGSYDRARAPRSTPAARASWDQGRPSVSAMNDARQGSHRHRQRRRLVRHEGAVSGTFPSRAARCSPPGEVDRRAVELRLRQPRPGHEQTAELASTPKDIFSLRLTGAAISAASGPIAAAADVIRCAAISLYRTPLPR